MKRNNTYSKWLAALFAGLMIIAGVSSAEGQGRYANRYSKRDVARIISTLETSSNVFRRDFDRNLDRSRRDGSSQEDRMNEIVRSYEDSLDRLRRNFDRRSNWWESQSDVQTVVSNAQQVDQMMARLSFAPQLERQWANMRRDINALADTFDMAGINGGGWNGGGNTGGWNNGNDGGWTGRGSAPNWAVGTFYGRNPQNGGTIILTVERSGRVTADFGVSRSFGTLNGQNLRMGNDRARISRINNGIRTTNTGDGEAIDYFRGGIGSGPIIDGPIGGGGNVPSWAVGTFYARNPNDGGTIVLVIRQDGAVTVDFGGGAVTYATMNNTTLQVDNETSRVTRIRNGIRTTSNSSGQTIDYRQDRPY